MPFLIAGTDRVGLVPAMLARRLPALADVRVIACPFPVADLVECLWWHERLDDDPGHRWFRSLLARAAVAAQSANASRRPIWTTSVSWMGVINDLDFPAACR